VETDNAENSTAINSVRKPSILLWVITAPQAILLLLNLNSYWVIKSEISAAGKSAALFVLIFQLLLFACGTLMYIDLKRRNRPVSWMPAAMLLALNIMYLWNFISNLTGILPFSIMPWVLDQGEVIYYQFIFVMPAIFYSAMILSSFKTKLGKRLDAGVSLLILLAIPLVWYVLFNIPFFKPGGLSAGMFLFIFVVVSTLSVIMLLLRILTAIYEWSVQREKLGMILLTFFAGIAAPLGGLWLNSFIPFPADFQAPAVYFLAIVNGLALIIPQCGNRTADRALWLVRCSTFPFTLYFFLIFLPFLPLALFAILAAGAGFLILAPTALFIIHCKRIGDGYTKLWEGARALPAVLAVAAVLFIPACFTISAVFDKISLSKAVDYIYSPDYVKQSRYEGSAAAAKNAILKLRNYKDGINVPLISSCYNKIVFNGMVLQDSKVENLYKIFEGKDIPKSPDGLNLLMSRSRHRGLSAQSRALRAATTSQVDMVSAEVSDVDCPGLVKKRVTINMKNTGGSNSEFNADIEVPPYVLVSGYWLKMDGELVPGSIFERKTAMWAYRMIRDSRRDPGLLIYKQDGRLNLSVYPFAEKEERVTVIEFMYPAGFSPDIRIGDRKVLLGDNGRADKSAAVSAAAGKGGLLLYLPGNAADKLPGVSREPYLYFVLDYSKNSGPQAPAYADRIKAICARFPDARRVWLTAANFEFCDIGQFDAKDHEGIKNAIMSCGLQRRGAFLKERAVKRSLLMYESDAMRDSPGSPRFMRYPVFIALTGKDAVCADEGSFSGFSAIVPEEKGYYVSVSGDAVDKVAFGAPPAKQVVVLKSSGELAVCGKGDAVVYFGASAGGDIEVFDGSSAKFRPSGITPVLLSGGKYPLAAQAWLYNIRLDRNPSVSSVLLREVVDLSRKSGVLVPATAYIVVENEAQKRRMELKEAQKLKSSLALSFDENPEEIEPLKASAPPLAVAALCVLVPVVLVRRLKRKSRFLTLPRP
jgi:hypothetical protein